MITLKEIYGAAMLLEGEGCFTCRKNEASSITIFCGMTDEEPPRRLHQWFGGNLITIKPRKPGYKLVYRWAISGTKAAGIMMTIYPLMSKRRKERIKELLILWKNFKKRPFSRIEKGFCKHGHTLSDDNIRRTAHKDPNGKIRELRVCLICHKERKKIENHSQYMKRKKKADLEKRILLGSPTPA